MPAASIEFIAVGSELLTPHFQDTNSLFVAEKLQELGRELSFKTTVGDRLDDLKLAIKIARKRSWLIFICGGLGPTEDDRTRQAVAEVLGLKLVFRRDILEKIRKRFETRGLRMSPSNRRQAYVLEGSEVLENPHGTAPGLWLERRKQIFVLLPGPPPEFRPMVENLVIPKLKERFGQVQVLRSVIRVTGAGESVVEDLIKPVYRSLPERMQLITLAAPGDIQIRLSLPVGQNPQRDMAAFNIVKEKLLGFLGRLVYSTDGEPLEKVAGDLLRSSGKTLACAESCTGGLLAHRITSVPGSSDYFLESIVTYSNESKIRELGVSAELLKQKGAVSEEVAREMAEKVRMKAGADYGLSTTGIAGPGGGTETKPVGLVYTALAFSGGTVVVKNMFSGNREIIKFQTTQKALDMLRLKLLEETGQTERK